MTIARNVDICKVSGEQGIVFTDRRTQQQRALIPNVKSQFREETRAFREDAFFAQSDPFDIAEAVEDSEHLSVLENPVAFISRWRFSRNIELRGFHVMQRTPRRPGAAPPLSPGELVFHTRLDNLWPSASH